MRSYFSLRSLGRLDPLYRLPYRNESCQGRAGGRPPVAVIEQKRNQKNAPGRYNHRQCGPTQPWEAPMRYLLRLSFCLLLMLCATFSTAQSKREPLKLLRVTPAGEDI